MWAKAWRAERRDAILECAEYDNVSPEEAEAYLSSAG